MRIVQRYIRVLLVLGFTFLIVSCSNTKFLKEGEMLYTGAKIKIDNDSISRKDKKALKSQLEENLTPKPNSTFLGLRPKLYFYNITKEPEKDKGFRYWMKYKLGEKPVLLQNVDREFNREIIVNYSENKGYFNAKASYDTISKNKKAKVLYTLNPGARYQLGLVEYEKDSTLINEEIQKLTDKSLLKTGQSFDLDVIKAERERINQNLKERGFYYFSPDNIIVQADSTVTNDRKVDLNVKLKDNTPELAKEQFSIDKVIVYPNYNIDDMKRGRYGIPATVDTLEGFTYNDIYVVDPDRKFKPKIFDRTLYFKSGDLYNRTNHNLTLNRLINLGVFKFVKNEFVVSDSVNHKFDVYYLLTPRKIQSLRLEALGKTNSANYAGSEVNLNWTNRNIFRGAEQLKVAVYGAFDVQMGGPKDAANIFRAGANATLSFPRIVAPFNFKSSSAFVPRTNISMGYEFMKRTNLYTLNNFNGSFGYVWKENVRKEHDLKILDITYVSSTNVTEKFDSISANNPFMQRIVQPQLIFGPIYSYTYTNTMFAKKNSIFYKGTLDLAGNIAGLITGGNEKKGNQKEIFGVPFSQFAKIENDFRYYHRFDSKNSIATRLIAGMAYPYGNSEYVPYSRQFFIGGSNSIRAFRARTLGPGSFDPRTLDNAYFFDQSGDIKLELNAEYRLNIYKFLNFAVFADAGNIWLVNEDADRPGGKFSKEWMSEIAVGGGIGLRFNFSILILRLDLAMPLRIPYYEKGDRWVIDKIDFGNRSWRKDNLILNIAIGYPF